MADPAPKTIVFTIGGPIDRADLPALCERVGGFLDRSGGTAGVCDVSEVEPDAVAIDALARLQLAARRHGCTLRLCHASDEVLELLVFMGLRDVLLCDDPAAR